MGRGPKPAKGKVKSAVARKPPKNDDGKVPDLEKRLAEALKGKAETLEQLQTRNRELTEAQEQQAATAEILRAINAAQTDPQLVFDAIARNVVRLPQALLLRADQVIE